MAVGVGVKVAVAVAVGEAVMVKVGEGVSVGVLVFVAVAVLVNVGVAVLSNPPRLESIAIHPNAVNKNRTSKIITITLSFIKNSLLFLLMPMPVMNIGHVVVLMLLGGMFMLMRVDSLCVVMSMRGIIVAVTVFME